MKEILKKHNILRIVAILTLLGTFCSVLAACELGDYVCKHEWVTDQAVAATCISEGLTVGQHCGLCGLVLTKQESMPKAEHTYDDEFDANCNACGAMRSVACRHDDMEHIAKKSPTCTEDGNIEYYYCADCKTYFVDKNATSKIEYIEILKYANGHTPEEIPGLEPTFTSSGWTRGTECSTCGEIIKPREFIDSLDPESGFIDYCNVYEADIPVEYCTYVKHIGIELPTPERKHYNFIGWYIENKDGSKQYLKEIKADNSAGEATRYRLFAEWELKTYTITRYVGVGNKLEDVEYTIEDINSDTGSMYIAGAPETQGMYFGYWTLGNPEEQRDNQTSMPEKFVLSYANAGDYVLTAVYKPMLNQFKAPKADDKGTMFFDSEMGMYYYIRLLGSYENVIISSSSLYWHSGLVPYDETVTINEKTSENKANSIANSVSSSLQKSSGYSYTHEHLEQTNKKIQHNWDIDFDYKNETSAGLSIEKLFNVGKKINVELGLHYGGSYIKDDTNSDRYVTVNNTSESSGSTSSMSQSVMTSYDKSYSKEITTKYNIPKESPVGWYIRAETATVHIFAILIYDVVNDTYYVNTYTVMDNYGDAQYYARTEDEYSFNPYELNYDIDMNKIESEIDSYGYIKFDANGGKGSMDVFAIANNTSTTLPKNTFTKDGYDFVGWKAPDGTIYQDSATIKSIVLNGECIELSAIWNQYTVYFDSVGGTNIDSMHYSDTNPLSKLPVPERNGYAFVGWYDNIDGQGTKYSDYTGKICGDLHEDKSLYACWAKISNQITEINQLKLTSQQIYSEKSQEFSLGLDIAKLKEAGYTGLIISITGNCGGYDYHMNSYGRYFVLSDAVTGKDLVSWTFKVSGFGGVENKTVPLTSFSESGTCRLQLVSDKSPNYNEKLTVSGIVITVTATKN